MEINQRKLYRDTHSTFPDYCREKWGFAKSRAYQLIESAKVVGNVHSCGQIEPPANEAQARPLAQLPVAQQANAWQDVVDECKERGEPVTAAAVADVVDTGPRRNRTGSRSRSPTRNPARSFKTRKGTSRSIADHAGQC